MNMYDIINRKKYGLELTAGELSYVVSGFTNGSIPDYQMAAFLMAVRLNGMTERETVDLTLSMAESGEMLDLSSINGVTADKHSTGGVGDKTTLAVGPIAASLGLKIAKMSGRGLGHTGGTIDKLESIPGFRTELTKEEFFRQVEEHGIAIVSQSAFLAPADKKIYALRDVTATVDSLPLVASSIMSKKLALGAGAIVLDVKVGNGAFMKTLPEAVSLAEQMVAIGNGAGRKTYALLTDMNQPLGRAVGNSLEVMEAIQCLKNSGPEDLALEVNWLSAFLLLSAGRVRTIEEGKELSARAVRSGEAFAKFAEMVGAQGGDTSCLYDTGLFPKASESLPVFPEATGFIESVNTEEIGRAGVELGAGRLKKDDIIDPAVGIILHKKIGDPVSDEPVATVYANDSALLEPAADRIRNAISLSRSPVPKPKTVYGFVDSEGFHAL